MATTYLLRTPSSATNQKTCTLSVWIKRSAIGVRQAIASQTVDGSNETFIWFDTNDELFLKESGEATYEFRTNRKFRDTSAWYHIVMAIDTTQSSGGNRVKLYVNGIQETSWASATDPALNDDTRWNSTTPFNIGRMNYGSEYFDGAMSHIHFIDGTVYTPSAFGETDATTGEWKIKTSPSVTYGTNGFFILKDGNSVTDQSGEGNNFTVGGGTLTKTEDNPSNVFATFNPLDVNAGTVTTFSNGNTTTMHNAGNNGATTAARSTLAYPAGKFYWETKCIATGGDVRTGIISMSSTDYNTQTNPFTLNECYNYKSNGDKGSWGDANSAYGATYTAGDIIGIAHDVSAGTLIFYKNGVSQGTAFTGLSTSLFWGAFSSEYNQGKYSYNFGNGYFGTTAVSSAGTNASNNGIFEYDVPTGYTALSTKGLNL